MNEQTKKQQGKLNLFDFLVILLAALIVLAGAAFFVYRARQATDTIVPIKYTILVRDLRKEININLTEGQTVIETVKRNPIGKITACRITPATYDDFNHETHTLVHGTYDDIQNVYVTIETDAIKTDREFTVEGMTLAVGTTVYFRTPTFIGSGYVVNLTELESPLDTDNAQ